MQQRSDVDVEVSSTVKSCGLTGRLSGRRWLLLATDMTVNGPILRLTLARAVRLLARTALLARRLAAAHANPQRFRLRRLGTTIGVVLVSEREREVARKGD